MLTVLTLICNPAEPRALAEALRAARAALSDVVRGDVALETLSEDEAADLLFDTDFEISALRRRVVTVAVELGVDAVVQGQENRRKRLLIADMDSTIVEQECLDELAAYAGVKPQIAAITDRAMRGEIAFEEALLERVWLLRGLDEKALDATWTNRITLSPGAKVLVSTMKKHGARAVLVSGGFTYFTSRVASAAGFDAHEANALATANGRLTGDVLRPIKGRAAKEEALLRYCTAYGVDLSQTLAAGDGANDLSMLARAGLGVAYRAKPQVAAAATARITHADLTALLYLQGYRRNEFSD